MTVSVGFIGAGGIASIHLETFDAVVDGYDIELAAVADVDEERARTAADSRDGTAYTDGEELIESEPLDALVVAVPPFAHGSYERMAAARDIDLFIEKPVGLSQTGHERRPNTLKKLVSSHKLATSVGTGE
ncbi:Gfo/Idh/MocA family protein [Halocatena marina]|uniref:Gfo/Idh/MocA family protein n=1 Tax=Halocatena marina TaxID=2934937 RepID=A0ABD5YL07_9EURY